MAGLSLECGDCKTQLRSVEEAQEHAELTGHTNFQELTKPVLNLVCTTCQKPCRSKTESDLHAKRTGHTEFTDETAETTKPFDLEKKPDGAPSAVGYYRRNGGARSAENIKNAITWIVDHEDDADIDKMPMVPAGTGGVVSLLTPEEEKAKAAELVEQGERAREKIRAKLEEDKAEQQRKLGLPPEETSTSAPPPVQEKKKSYVPVRPATKADQMRDILRSIKQTNKHDDAKERVANLGGVRFLELCGFEKDQSGKFVINPREKVDSILLQTAGSEINSAIVNPFFDVL
ncbi:unnamed protein product [Calypogeia fissa]